MTGDLAENNQLTVLIVDDDEAFHCFVASFLDGFRLLHAHNSWECVELLAHGRVDVILLDLNLPDAAGFRVLENMRAQGDDAAVIVVSSYADRDKIQQARAWGARAVLDKTPENCRRLPRFIRQILSEPARDTPRWDPHREHHRAFARLEQSTSLGVRRLVREARMAALAPGPVLVESEPGSDRQLVARYIHAWADDAAAPFVVTTATPGSEFTASLFGHAERDDCLLASADGGTLFLDQVHRLDAAAQAYLQQLLSLGSVGCGRPEGAELRVQVRIVAATTKHLDRAVHDQGFSPALHKALRRTCLNIPPLRERRMDLAAELAELMESAAASLGVERPDYGPDLAADLARYPFPGNEQELRAMVESVCARRPGQRITARDLLAHHAGWVRS